MIAIKIGIGVYGSNGHQIDKLKHDKAQIVAAAACERAPEHVKRYETLAQMLEDKAVDMVSLCSPRRADQARDAILCMEAGKHVYAEKPCALSAKELDEILAAAKRTGRIFHEMANTTFEAPYTAMKRIVAEGTIGEVVQVLAQKSYPMNDSRPQDDDTDGGLIRWVGVHAVRFIEHVTGLKIVKVTANETSLGNPKQGGGLKVAASLMMELENGGVATAIANYLNPKGFVHWGNEHLRIFGTKGFVESVDAGTRTRLIVGDNDMGALKIPEEEGSIAIFLDNIIDQILGLAPPLLSPEDELHPTRVVIAAKESALSQKTVIV